MNSANSENYGSTTLHTFFYICPLWIKTIWFRVITTVKNNKDIPSVFLFFFWEFEGFRNLEVGGILRLFEGQG